MGDTSGELATRANSALPGIKNGDVGSFRRGDGVAGATKGESAGFWCGEGVPCTIGDLVASARRNNGDARLVLLMISSCGSMSAICLRYPPSSHRGLSLSVRAARFGLSASRRASCTDMISLWFRCTERRPTMCAKSSTASRRLYDKSSEIIWWLLMSPPTTCCSTLCDALRCSRWKRHSTPERSTNWLREQSSARSDAGKSPSSRILLRGIFSVCRFLK
mmetsp:Transcript_3434/g.5517  ORF Transcript_3434/g.5517 Transcript_3434/m.5517 type:complete len:220 (-) Transcript_3434:597-1256(-)